MIIKRAIWLFTFSLVILAIFLPGYSKLQELRERNKDLEEKIRLLSKENQILQEEFERLRTDPSYLEKFAREKTGVVRKGEIPIKIIPAQ